MDDPLPRPRLAAGVEACTGCGTALAPDQRYCLACARRRGAPRVDPALAPVPSRSVEGASTTHGTDRDVPVPGERPSWGAPLHRGRVQPIVPAVAAVLAGLLIGVTTSAGSASPAPAGGPYVVQLPPGSGTAPPAALPALGLLPPSVAVEEPAVVAEVPEPAEEPLAEQEPLAEEPLPDEPLPDEPADPAADDEEEAADDEAGEEPAGTPEAAAFRHVFLITLSDQPASRTYAPDSPAPFLAKELAGRGVLLPNHHAVTRGGLANTIAMLSGQGPTPETQAGCPVHADRVAPPGTESPGADGQERGPGCVHSPVAGTIADQLRGSDRDWAAYVEGMAAGGPGVPAACRRPAPGAPDPTVAGRPGDPYATARNPLLFFRSITDDAEGCAARNKDLGLLTADLERPAKDAPALTVIAPSPLRSGTDVPFTPGEPAGGLAGADAFLREWVPRIEASSAYRDGGLLVITTDQAPEPAPPAVAESCCLAPTFPDVPAGQPGGGRVGLLLLSEDLAAPGTTLEDPTNHFDLLRSLQDGFGLAPLGYAAREEVTGLPLARALKPAG